MQLRSIALASLLVVASSACKKPEPPRLVPKSAKITEVNLAGIDMVLTVDATNPNAIPLSARSVTANMVVDKKYPLGSTTIPHAVTLPPNATTTIEVPIAAKWQDLTAFTALAGRPGPVLYDVDGTVNVGTDTFNVDVPFTLHGAITHEMLVNAAVRSIPKIPGLN